MAAEGPAGVEESRKWLLELRDVPLAAENGWREIDGFVCRRCGHPAFAHPDTNRLWACLHCRLMEISLSLFFTRIE